MLILMTIRQTLSVLLLSVSVSLFAQNQAPAFPGAEGFARYTTTGGRGQSVYHVTNLNDSGTGSLRDALSQGNRIIVFDISGYIDLKSDLKISKKNITIAGQTAPGDGITLRYYTLNFSDASAENIIVRFLRFRRSQVKNVNDGADAAWGRNNKNIIIDHCSFSWSIDEIASFYDNQNFSMQWCTLGEALRNPGHSKGEHSYGGIWGGKGASFHHNFLAHMQNRAPRFNGARYGWTGGNDTEFTNPVQAERVDFRNCVMFNWGTGNGCYGGPGGGQINIVNNYYKAGPATKNTTRVTEINVATSSNADTSHPEYYGYTSRYYIDGNYVSAADKPQNYDWNGVKYDSDIPTINGARYSKDVKGFYASNVTRVKNSAGEDCVPIKMDKAEPFGEVTTHTAETAYQKVLAYAGASLVRDAVDSRYMEEASTGTATYKGTATVSGDGKSVTPLPGIVDLINDPAGTADPLKVSFPELKSETRPSGFDSDGDGMPDEWEKANGLNPNDASDGKTYTLDNKGFYTNVEVYINSIVENIVKAQNEGALTAVEEYYPSFQTSGIEIVSKQPVKFFYFDLFGKPVKNPEHGTFIRKQVFDDGTTYTDKVIAQ